MQQIAVSGSTPYEFVTQINRQLSMGWEVIPSTLTINTTTTPALFFAICQYTPPPMQHGFQVLDAFAETSIRSMDELAMIHVSRDALIELLDLREQMASQGIREILGTGGAYESRLEQLRTRSGTITPVQRDPRQSFLSDTHLPSLESLDAGQHPHRIEVHVREHLAWFESTLGFTPEAPTFE